MMSESWVFDSCPSVEFFERRGKKDLVQVTCLIFCIEEKQQLPADIESCCNRHVVKGGWKMGFSDKGSEAGGEETTSTERERERKGNTNDMQKENMKCTELCGVHVTLDPLMWLPFLYHSMQCQLEKETFSLSCGGHKEKSKFIR